LDGDSTSDPSITLVASSVKLCDPTTNPAQVAPNCTLTTLNVPGVGTYAVVNGVMTFTPEANFVGTPTPVAYQVSDSLGATTGSTYTPTVIGTPTASPNTTTGGKGAPQEVSLIANDSAATGATLDPTSVKLCDPNPTAEVAPDCTKTSVTVAGVGTYSVDSTGKMTFTPDPNYVGTPPALSYTVTDSLGSKASSTYTPTVIGTPTATPDTSSGPQGVAQSRNVVTNTSGTSDAAAAGTNLVSSTVTLSCASAPNCTRNSDGTVTIANQGTYSAVAADGTVVFTPTPTFTGTATPVTYTISDALGQSATTTYTPTVIPAPVAINDTSTNGQDKNQLINVLLNDTVPTNPAGDPLNPTTVKLCAIANPTATPPVSAEVAPNCTLTTLTTADGTYTVNPTTGIVTFDPIPSFTGTVSVPVRYQVSDTGSTPQVTSATITPTVIPGPTAANDTSSGPMNTPQTKTLVTNDSAATGATLDIASVKLCDPNPTAEVAPNCTKTLVTVPNVGTYSVDSSGVMTFTPVNGYSGTPAPLAYTVADNFGVKATATYTPKVIPPPIVVPDTSSGPWNTDQTRNVLTNNVNTSDSAAPGTTLVTNSVRLCAPTTDTAPNCTIDASGSVVIANQGTYTLDPATGIVTFDPLPTFKGTATPVTYSVTDELGQKSSTTYTPTVAAPPVPMADPETTSGVKGATQTINLLPGDTTFDPAITLDPASVKLCGINPAEVMPNCTKSSLTVAGVGTYSVDATGQMSFIPEPNFTGTPAPISYQVTDSMGGKATSTYTPTVIAPPVVRPDTTTGGWDVIQSINVVTSTAGANTTNTDTTSADSISNQRTWKSDSLTIDCASAANCTETVDSNGVVTAVTMTGQGTYTVNPATNVISFNPEASFIGTARPVTYTISDDLNQSSSTTYTPMVVVPVPAATPEVKNATLVLVNPSDTSSENLNFGDMRWKTTFATITGTSGLASGTGLQTTGASATCLVADAKTTPSTGCVTSLTIAGEGTYTIDQATGVVTFLSEVVIYDTTGSNIAQGPKTPVSYRVTDAFGRSATSTLTPVIPKPPVANPDVSVGVQGESQTLSPVGNDRPGTGPSTTLYPDTRAQTPSGIFLCAANQPPPDCRASEVEVFENNVKLGTLTVSATGAVTFMPEPDFVGTTPPIGYQIPDNLGQKAYSTITITVLPPPAPDADFDSGSAEYNKTVTLKPWLNDSPGSAAGAKRPDGTSYPEPNLIKTSIKLCDDNETFVAMSLTAPDCTATKVKTIEGTYEVNAKTGEVVFTPVDGFVGTVKYPPTYQIWTDWQGPGIKSATALLFPTISPPGAPAAEVDVTKTKPGTSVILNPVGNDIPGAAALDPTTIRLCGEKEVAPECTLMEATTLDGTYVVDPKTGEVTFTPRDGFTGKATIPYVIKDAMGMVAASHLIITVEDTEVVPVVAKEKVGLAKTGGTRPDLLLLLGILAMVGAGGLRRKALKAAA
jgi:CshA-type fibril repeat protein